MSRGRSMTQLVLLLGLMTVVLQVRAQRDGGDREGDRGRGDGGHGGHGGGGDHGEGGRHFGPGGFSPGEPPFGLAMMLECANDSCVPADLKTQIKSSWNQTTQTAFDTCVQQSGGPECTPANFKEVFMCLMKDDKQEKFAIIKDMSEKLEGLDDKITIKMLSCLREQRGGRGHGPFGGGEGGRGPFGPPPNGVTDQPGGQ